jgi:hypothetical protein
MDPWYQALLERLNCIISGLEALSAKIDDTDLKKQKTVVGFDDIELERTAVANADMKYVVNQYVRISEESDIVKKLERFKLNLRDEYLAPGETIPPVIDEAIREIERLRSTVRET